MAEKIGTIPNDDVGAPPNAIGPDAAAELAGISTTSEEFQTAAKQEHFRAEEAHRRLGDKNETDLFAYLLEIGEDPNALSTEAADFLNENNLSDEFSTYVGVKSGMIQVNPELQELLEKTDFKSLDNDAYREVMKTIKGYGFDALKQIEYKYPGLIKKLQEAQMERGLYVNDVDHRFYLDGKIGREATSMTWFGIENAAEEGTALAQATIDNTVTSSLAGDLVKLRAQIALNKINETTENVGNKLTEAHAQALMVEASKDGVDIGNGLLRLLSRSEIDSETLNAWAEVYGVTQQLEQARTSYRFDYEIGTATASTLLAFIREHEANSNYNIAWGGTTVIYGGEERLPTTMKISEILDWQLKNGEHAIGAYQYKPVSLKEIVDVTPGVTVDTIFSPEVQDKLAMTTLFKKRGLNDYLNGKISLTKMIENLANEWAILPKNRSGGAHDDVGTNKAKPELYDELQRLLIEMKENYQRGILPPTVRSAAYQALPQDAPIMIVDPGHGIRGGTDKGATTSAGTTESDVADAVAREYMEVMAKEGVRVIFTREPGRYLSGGESFRWRIGQAQAKIAANSYSGRMIGAISIHFDGGDSTARSTMLTDPSSTKGSVALSKRLAAHYDDDRDVTAGRVITGSWYFRDRPGVRFGFLREAEKNGLDATIVELGMSKTADDGFLDAVALTEKGIDREAGEGNLPARRYALEIADGTLAHAHAKGIRPTKLAAVEPENHEGRIDAKAAEARAEFTNVTMPPRKPKSLVNAEPTFNPASQKT